MGANGLTSDREQNDFYATEPKATELLLEKRSIQSEHTRTMCRYGSY